MFDVHCSMFILHWPLERSLSPWRILREFPLQGSAVNSEKLRGLADIAGAIRQHPLNVFPLNSREAWNGNWPGSLRRLSSDFLISRENLVHVHGFAQIVIRAQLQCLQRRRDTSISGEDNDCDRGVEGLDRRNGVEPIGFRHPQVEKNKIRAYLLRDFEDVCSVAEAMGFPSSSSKRAA